VRETTGFTGAIEYDSSKPDGAPRKLMDVSLMRRLGWNAKIGLREGLAETYRWFVQRYGAVESGSLRLHMH
jgi:GDP-L-fucose synthase